MHPFASGDFFFTWHGGRFYPHSNFTARTETSFSRSFHAMRSLLNFSGFAYIMLSARFAHFFT
jgi:hypothetical protein